MSLHHGSPASLRALSWLSFLNAMMLTAFGAFVAVDLSAAGWNPLDIGVALSVTSIANLAAQVPGGTLVDMTQDKRRISAVAIALIALAALMIGVWQQKPVVFVALAMQGAASAVLVPAVTAISLALVAPDTLSLRLGLNTRYAALGTACAAGAMGVLGTLISDRISLYFAALVGLFALVALRSVRGKDLEQAAEQHEHVSVGRAKPARRRAIFAHPALISLGVCLLLFQLGNADVLPLAASTLVGRDANQANLLVGAAVVISQLGAAWLSAPFGRLAQTNGRRLVLLLGLAALPIKALLFATDGNSLWIVVYQSLDAISAASVGVVMPLLVADITHRRGHFNLALGLVGFASGLGGAAGTTVSGAIADRLGIAYAYGAIALIGLAAAVLARATLRETRGPNEEPARLRTTNM
jgi:MFS family permease